MDLDNTNIIQSSQLQFIHLFHCKFLSGEDMEWYDAKIFTLLVVIVIILLGIFSSDVLHSSRRYDFSTPNLFKFDLSYQRQPTLSPTSLRENKHGSDNRNPSSKDSEKQEIENQTKFDKALENYVRSLNTFKGAVIVECIELDLCGGLGDRLKLIITGAALALLTNRVLIVNMKKDVDMEEYYQPNAIEWRPSKWNKFMSKGLKNLIPCVEYPCGCLVKGFLREMQNEDIENQVTTIKANYDCLQMITRVDGIYERANKFGMIEENVWQSKLFDAIFKPNKNLDEAINKMLVPLGQDPTYGLHVRIGGSELNDQVRTKDKNFDLSIGLYAKCVYYMRSTFTEGSGNVTIFIAADNAKAISDLEFLLSDEGVSILTSKDIGALGHIERQHTENSDLRMFVDFEILRRSRYILVGDSGFSMMAYVLRKHFHSIAFADFAYSQESCHWIFMHHGVEGNARA